MTRGKYDIQSVQFSSVFQSCQTLCDSMNLSTPGLPVHHQLSEFTQIHVHWAGDAIQLSHPLSSPYPPTCNLSQHQGFSSESTVPIDDQNIGASGSASVLPVNIQGWFPLRWTGLIFLLSKGLSGVLSSTIVQRHRFFGALTSLRSSSHNRMWSIGRP